jgi:uncharacterized membrane protein
MSNTETELQKEFELERMILFSDAVFAIAITLLIIEIKFPEIHKHSSSQEILTSFKPVVIRFLGFMLSFFYIGLTWARHLKVCKYMRSYDNGVIFRNLVLLFFIVCFPFTASGLTEHIRPGFLLPFFIYIFNILFVSFSHYALCSYIFKAKPVLSIAGYEIEKKFIFLQSKYFSFSLLITVLIIVMLSISFPGTQYPFYGFYALPVLMMFIRRHLKRYKPVHLSALKMPPKENDEE